MASFYDARWDEWVPYPDMHRHKMAALYSMFPILKLRFHSLSESNRTDAVVSAIRRSFDFGMMSALQMAHYWAEGVETRLWEAITVLVPKHKVLSAVRLGRRIREDREDEDYERRCEQYY